MNPRAAAMLSFARELRDSIRFYNRLARRYPAKHDHYRQEARRALRGACFYLSWARDEASRFRERERSFPTVEDYRARLILKTKQDEAGCWIWQGQLDRDGYGQFCMRGRGCKAHRASYELFVGKLNPRLTIDHLCKNTSCVNPAHLEQVSNAENIMRGNGFGVVNSQKTHCRHGHAFNEQNTYVDRLGKRHCKTCDRIRKRIAVRELAK